MGICPKVNMIVRLEFELAYYIPAVLDFSHFTSRTPPKDFSFERLIYYSLKRAHHRTSTNIRFYYIFIFYCDNCISSVFLLITHSCFPRRLKRDISHRSTNKSKGSYSTISKYILSTLVATLSMACTTYVRFWGCSN